MTGKNIPTSFIVNNYIFLMKNVITLTGLRPQNQQTGCLKLYIKKILWLKNTFPEMKWFRHVHLLSTLYTFYLVKAVKVQTVVFFHQFGCSTHHLLQLIHYSRGQLQLIHYSRGGQLQLIHYSRGGKLWSCRNLAPVQHTPSLESPVTIKPLMSWIWCVSAGTKACTPVPWGCKHTHRT